MHCEQQYSNLIKKCSCTRGSMYCIDKKIIDLENILIRNIKLIEVTEIHIFLCKKKRDINGLFRLESLFNLNHNTIRSFDRT